MTQHSGPRGYGPKTAIRTARGDRSASSKITEVEALEIIRRRTAGELGTDLAREFGLHSSEVYRIASGKKRPHLSQMLQSIPQDAA